MKPILMLLCMTFLIFGIQNNNLLSNNNNINEERKESYEACLKLRSKAPNLNLKCERLIENIINNRKTNENDEINNTEIKTLSLDESVTRKVNKSEEKKLRNLIKKLSYENKLRKD
jgi:hypothetical protein